MATAEDILSLIEEHGLSIRQIPKEIFGTCGKKEHISEDEEFIGEVECVIQEDCDETTFLKYKHQRLWGDTFYWKDRKIYRKFFKYRRIPNNPGKWMAKQVNDTSTSVSWSIKKDNLSTTLEEAVLKCVESIVKSNKSIE
jgi:hypothetical protein